jgi:thiol-disulfide isomerase/thioredoxin
MIARALPFAAAALALLAAAPVARASADSDWAAIVALDKGPAQKPASRDEALRIARAWFDTQSAALRAFLAAYPADPRALDAKLRLTSIRAAEGEMDRKPEEVRAALLELLALEKSKDVPPARLPDVAFRRISLQMQTLEGTPDQVREAVVTAARNYAARFPGDKRAPRLLVEAATQCDDVPNTMRDLLLAAKNLSREPALDARIADDLRRMEALGRPVAAKFSTIQGGTIDLSRLRGRVVVLVFWAAESPPSVIWMESFLPELRKLASAQLTVIGVSLDSDRANLLGAMRALGIDWPTHFDGKGWDNALGRQLGINALPTVWVLDKKGNLRTLNARETYAPIIRQLLRER